MAAGSSSAIVGSLRKCSVLLIRCDFGLELDGDARQSLSSQMKARSGGLSAPSVFQTSRTASSMGLTTDRMRECSVRLMRWESQLMKEVSQLSIKTERDAEKTVVVSNELDMEQKCSKGYSDCDQFLHAEVDNFIIKTEEGTDRAIVKEELEIGPVVLQTRAPAQQRKVTLGNTAWNQLSSPMAVVNYKCEDNAEDVHPSSTSFMYMNIGGNHVDLGAVPRHDQYKDCNNSPCEAVAQSNFNDKRFRQYICDHCGHTTKRNCNLKAHMHKHTKTESFKNKQGGDSVPKRENTKKLRKDKLNICKQRENSTFDKRYLKSHIYKDTDQKLFKCEQCKYRANEKSSLKRHKLIHTGNKPFNCDLCGYGTYKKNGFNKHMRIHIGDKPFLCEICGFRAFQNNKLKRHMATHTVDGTKINKCEQSIIDAKLHKCQQCQYSTSLQSNLIIHLRTHTGERPYKCERCEYSASQKGTLKYHMLRHTGEKPHKCEHCEYSSILKISVKYHMRKHIVCAVDKPHKCSHCGFSTYTKYQLKIHMYKHTGEKPYKCEHCEYTASNKTRLKCHMRRHIVCAEDN